MKLKELQDKIELQGGHLYIVGGAVRDTIMGVESKDTDYVFTGVHDIDALGLGSLKGKDFPVFIVDIDGVKCEVAAARLERSIGPGSADFNVNVSAEVTIEQDLKRRDLTINSMAVEVGRATLIDPFCGRLDIQFKKLRHTSEAFAEDPARVFRLARFAARFPDFEIAQNTFKLCTFMRGQLKFVPAERVFKEMEKALLTKHPSKFFTVLRDMRCSSNCFFKEINMLNVPDGHDGTAFNHTMRCIDAAVTPEMRFGLLCHDLGKGRTPKDKHPTHYGHDALGVDAVKDLCVRLRVPNHLRALGIAASRDHMRMKLTSEMKAKTVFKFFMETMKTADFVNTLSSIDSEIGGYVSSKDINHMLATNRTYISFVRGAYMEITAKDLIEDGMEPGPELGRALYNRRLGYFKVYRREYLDR